MAVQRYYYSDSITNFLSRSTDEIVGRLTLAFQHDINDETSQSWVTEIETLRDALDSYAGRGSLYLEYNIPRMGRRADVIVVIDGKVFVLEYKTSEQRFTRDAYIQVWDYALDLKNFQDGCNDRIIIPVLVAPKERDANCKLTLKYFEDMVYEPLLVNHKKLAVVFDMVMNLVHYDVMPELTDEQWV